MTRVLKSDKRGLDSITKDKIVDECTDLIRRHMELIITRFHKYQYHGWIDTKYDPVTLNDFEDDLIHSKDTIYSWIQGRALESLSTHCRWFEKRSNANDKMLARRLDPIAAALDERLSKTWNQNSGHLFFFMSPDGSPFKIEGKARIPVRLMAGSPANYSDLFAAKGLYASAVLFQNAKKLQDAKQYCKQVLDCILSGKFVSDQQALDPQNPCVHDPAKRMQGPYMIAIGMANLLLHAEPNLENVQTGLELIKYLIDNHTNFDGHWPELDNMAFVEFIDSEGKPFRINNAIILDPGHAMEFVGLSLKFFDLVLSSQVVLPEQAAYVAKMTPYLIMLFQKVFERGFMPAGGFCKSFDLLTCRPINTDMPWWSLPETMRAGAYCVKSSTDKKQQEFAFSVLQKCYNALLTNYIVSNQYRTVIQTRAEDGSIAKSIPATADMDPGYHTGLSLIDCVDILLGCAM